MHDSVYVSGTKQYTGAISANTNYTLSYTCSGTVGLYPTGLNAGDVIQVYSPSKITGWNNHKHTNNVYIGKLVTYSDGNGTITTSPTSIQTYNGSGSVGSVTVSFPVSVVCSREYITSIGYDLSVFSSCSYTCEFTWWYRQVYNYTTGQKLDTLNDSVKDVNETSKGILSRITDFFGSFFQNLINSVVSLFVPSADEMSGLFEQLNQFFSDRFGFLYAPFDYFIRLLNIFLAGDGAVSLTFPGFEILGETVWEPYTYDFSSEPLVGTIFGYVRTGTGILLAGWFIMYLQDFFKERFGTG